MAATIDEECIPRDVARIVGREEERRTPDVLLGIAHAVHGGVGQDLLLHFRVLGHHRDVGFGGRCGADDIAEDLVARPLTGRASRQGAYRFLRRVVVHGVHVRIHAVE